MTLEIIEQVKQLMGDPFSINGYNCSVIHVRNCSSWAIQATMSKLLSSINPQVCQLEVKCQKQNITCLMYAMTVSLYFTRNIWNINNTEQQTKFPKLWHTIQNYALGNREGGFKTFFCESKTTWLCGSSLKYECTPCGFLHGLYLSRVQTELYGFNIYEGQHRLLSLIQ